jgi:hypothetical protein
VKTSTADGTTVIEENKTLAITVGTPGEINDASEIADAMDKLEDKKNLPLA